MVYAQSLMASRNKAGHGCTSSVVTAMGLPHNIALGKSDFILEL